MKPMHGRALANLQLPGPGQAASGRFGRMFPGLPGLIVASEKLEALAATMIDSGASSSGDNPDVPAGFTYLGQFVDHDITLDTAALGERLNDVTGRMNFRTPRLDLDSVYGIGPDGSPHLYDRLDSKLLAIGICDKGGAGDPKIKALLPNDLPRSSQGAALIGDPRNDENLLVAQTHLAFLKFHNKVLKDVAGDDFSRAREIVTWHYQWIVLFDLLAKVIDFNALNDVLKNGRRFYLFEKQGTNGEPFMPVEFSGAAYRLGHSMIRTSYSHNRAFNDTTAVPASLEFLFQFSGKSGGIVGDLARGTPAEIAARTAILKPIKGFIVPSLPGDWPIDWHRFFDLGQPTSPPPGATPPKNNFVLNLSRLIDPYLIPALHSLPGGGGSLPARNLKRGVDFGLPSGQAIAKAMGLPTLTPDQIAASGADGAKAKELGLTVDTPLWYYILKEAQLLGNSGHRLGPIGSRILAEVFVGMLQGDANSFLRKAPAWTPTLPSKAPGQFSMADLLRYVDDIDPVNVPSNQS